MRAITAATALVFVLAACASSQATTGSKASPAGTGSPAIRIGDGGTNVGTANAKVEVRDSSFSYQGNGDSPVVTIKVGDVVEWDWGADLTVAHNMTFGTLPLMLDNLDPQASSPHQLNAGAVWQVRFTSAGQFHYVCTFHSGSMRGSVVVTQ